LIILFSCSSGTNDKESKVDIFDGRYDSTVFSKKSFEDIGFKFSKEYDVTELPDAKSAYYGFWGKGSFERLSYELRFYATNEIARSSGTFYAEEVTGEDAIIKKADATWKEGIKDRSGAQFTSTVMAKYLDYVIFGNVIVLCPSEKSTAVTGAWDPIENCRNLLLNLPETRMVK
jgi:hypothetical protein